MQQVQVTPENVLNMAIAYRHDTCGMLAGYKNDLKYLMQFIQQNVTRDIYAELVEQAYLYESTLDHANMSVSDLHGKRVVWWCHRVADGISTGQWLDTSNYYTFKSECAPTEKFSGGGG